VECNLQNFNFTHKNRGGVYRKRMFSRTTCLTELERLTELFVRKHVIAIRTCTT